MSRNAIAAAVLCFLLVTAAHAGRTLKGGGAGRGDRPAHDYSSVISMQATTAALAQAFAKGHTKDAISDATKLSLQNAQQSTKFWGYKGAKFADGVQRSKVESEDGDSDDDK